MSIAYLSPTWPLPSNVRALTTLRFGGVSRASFSTFNLAAHVGDKKADVAYNRARLRTLLDLPAEPLWLTQVHGTTIVDASLAPQNVEADGSMTKQPKIVCAVMTADCLPVLVCEKNGQSVAALHAGWRGLGLGVLEAGIAALKVPPQQLLVWIGPGIGPKAFEVGVDVVDFFGKYDANARTAFLPCGNNKYKGDLYTIAKQRLIRAGIRPEHIYSEHWCTASDTTRFFSFRQEGTTGRMASLIWIE